MNNMPDSRARNCLIPKYIGSDFDHVINVASHIDEVINVSEHIPDIKLVNTKLDKIDTVADNIDAIEEVSDNIEDIKDLASFVGKTEDHLIANMLKTEGYNVVGNATLGCLINDHQELVVHKGHIYRYIGSNAFPIRVSKGTNFEDGNWAIDSFRGSVKDWDTFDAQLLEEGGLPVTALNEPDSANKPSRLEAIKNINYAALASSIGLVFKGLWKPNTTYTNLKTTDALWQSDIGQLINPKVGGTVTTGVSFADDMATGRFEESSILTAKTPFYAGKTTTPHSLQDRFSRDSVNAADYGVVVNDPSKGVHNFNAIRSAVMDCLLQLPEVDVWDAIHVNKSLELPAGKIYISGNSPLRIAGQDLIKAGSKSGYRSGFYVFGQGRGITEIVLDHTTGADVWLYDSQDGETTPITWGYSACTFDKFTLTSTNDSASRSGDGEKVNGFRLNSSGWESWFNYNQMVISNLDNVFTIVGNKNADEATYTDCQIFSIRDSVLFCDNNQSLMNVFKGCNIESIMGSVFDVYAGSYVVMNGGSIILYPEFDDNGNTPYTDIRAFLRVRSGKGQESSYRSNIFEFTNITFECYDKYNRILSHSRTDGGIGSGISVRFNGCNFATEMEIIKKGEPSVVPSWDRRDAFHAEGGTRTLVDFYNCELNNFHEYHISSKSGFYSRSWMRFHDCELMWDVADTTLRDGKSLATRCFADNQWGAFSALGTTCSQKTERPKGVHYALDFEKNNNPTNTGLNTVIKSAVLHQSTDCLPPALGSRLYLPKGSQVLSITLNKPADNTTGSNYGISLKRSTDKVTIWTSGQGDSNREIYAYNQPVTSPFWVGEKHSDLEGDYVYLSLAGVGASIPDGGFAIIHYI